MPKSQMDYKNTIIYKIVCNDLNVKDCYIGHTTNFSKRKCHHKSNCNKIEGKCYNFKVYKCIRDNLGWNNWSMYEVEKYPCNDRNEAEQRERYWIELLNANLNSYIPTRTSIEYRKINADKISQQQKEYRQLHSNEIKEYRKINADKISQQRKEYRQLHSNEIKEYNNNYDYSYRRVKIQCDCGSSCSLANISTHRKTKKHIEYMRLNNDKI